MRLTAKQALRLVSASSLVCVLIFWGASLQQHASTYGENVFILRKSLSAVRGLTIEVERQAPSEYWIPRSTAWSQREESTISEKVPDVRYPRVETLLSQNTGSPNRISHKRISQNRISQNNISNAYGNFSLSSRQLRSAIECGNALPLLTLFSTWPDSETDPEHAQIRNLTMRNWSELRPFVVPVLMTNTSQHAARAKMNGWRVMPVSRTAVGVPILKDMYSDVMKRFNTTLYAFANGDILFTESLVETLLTILTSLQHTPQTFTSSHMTSHYHELNQQPLLIAGRRTNVKTGLLSEAATFQGIAHIGRHRGQLDVADAIDYFITNRYFAWSSIPDLVIGRIAYDNWVIGHAIRQHYTVVDATSTLLSVHQVGKKGIREGHSRPNVTYNLDLVTRLHQQHLISTVECMPFKTRMRPDGEITVTNVRTPFTCHRVSKGLRPFHPKRPLRRK